MQMNHSYKYHTMCLAIIYIFSMKIANGLLLPSSTSNNKITYMENFLENINTIHMFNTNELFIQVSHYMFRFYLYFYDLN